MSRRNFSDEEKKIIEFWEKNKIFEKSVERTPIKGDYIFYDGPPFATGLPHYGHIVASILKDIVPRYWTMKGYRVERKWGWDCHGLPIENLIEKQLGVNSKREIEEKVGVEAFNKACFESVLTYAEEWKKVIRRLGRWVDMENDYKTMDLDFMESVWWVFSQLWEKGLIYKSYKSMHICPRCETTLSQSEVSQGYSDIEDLSAVVKFKLLDSDENEDVYFLAWTTTPWTLFGNVALAVGENIDYVKVRLKDVDDNKEYSVILAKDIFEQAKNNQEHFLHTKFNENILSVEDVDIKEYIEKKYKPLFELNLQDKNIDNLENAYIIVFADFVNTEEGTGIVHIAGGFGQDDFELCKKHNLPFIQHVSMDGRIKAEFLTDELQEFVGLEVKPKHNPAETDEKIVQFLQNKDLLFAQSKYLHSYPHCWRCDSPLLNYSTGSWFVAVTKIHKQLLEQAEKINWIPAHLKQGRFGQWLAGAKDWSISRQRYWGSVIPVWECQSCGEVLVFGSIKELEQASGEKVNDLHKHIVDKIEVDCKCGGKMKRIPDVLDCWFESGSMPYAQMHYPFENKEKFEKNFPAKYIAEGVDQTRCWFYYLHVLGVAIMGKPAFENVVVNGIVLAEDGKKMSKRLNNYPDPMDIMEKYGSDAMRLYLASSPVVQAEDLRFSETGVEEVFKKVMMIWWNVFSFYEMYKDDSLLEKNIQNLHILDKWILELFKKFKKHVTEAMDNYELMKASRQFFDFVNEVSTWYLRRSRDRFKSDNQEERAGALQTLRYILIEASKIMCPFIPFITEDIYLHLRKDQDPESIHLCYWPELEDYDKNILEKMQKLREIVELVLSIRATKQIKIRQALSELKIFLKGFDFSPEYIQILKDELNVKNIVFVENKQDIKQDDFWVCNSNKEIEVSLNTEITQELKLEGLARELVRYINLLRKDKGLTIKDKAEILISTKSNEIKSAIERFKDFILHNTKSTNIIEQESLEDGKVFKIDGFEVILSLKK